MQRRTQAKLQRAEFVFLSPEEAIALFDKMLILDVQNPKYTTTTVPGAQRLNVDILLRNIAKDQPILLTCLCGRRSLAAAEQLVHRGYRSVYVLKGGVLAWGQAGYILQRIQVFA